MALRAQYVRVEGLEPPWIAPPDPKSGMSTNFTTPAFQLILLTFNVSAISLLKGWQIYRLFGNSVVRFCVILMILKELAKTW